MAKNQVQSLVQVVPVDCESLSLPSASRQHTHTCQIGWAAMTSTCFPPNNNRHVKHIVFVGKFQTPGECTLKYCKGVICFCQQSTMTDVPASTKAVWANSQSLSGTGLLWEHTASEK